MGLDLFSPEDLWVELYEFYGERLANPDREPKRFSFQLKIFKHVRNINNNGHNPNQQ